MYKINNVHGKALLYDISFHDVSLQYMKNNIDEETKPTVIHRF